MIYSIDDRKFKIARIAALKAEGIIESASEAFEMWMASQNNHRLISQLRTKADQIRHETLQRPLKELDKGKDPKAVLTHFAHRLTQKLIHQPTVDLAQETSRRRD